MVQVQEELGLDVLVHGEPERNDMVEYFGRQLDGFCFTPKRLGAKLRQPLRETAHHLRRRFSSRGDDRQMDSIRPITDQPSHERDAHRSGHDSLLEFCPETICRVRKYANKSPWRFEMRVSDLENAGIRLIQIDEAALREGMPLREGDAKSYLRWAVDCFRLTASGVDDATQIHTHMCYSEFNKIIESIAEMDADVISIEASRSNMELLHAFQDFEYPNEIGPGVYDIHSPRVPTVEEMLKLLQTALKVIPPERLWVNPDCGLKTRQWPETLQALKNMVEAAKLLRKEQDAASTLK